MIQQMLAIWSLIHLPWVSLVVQMGNNPSARQESWVWSLGRITCWFTRAWAKTNIIAKRSHGASISDSPSFLGFSLRNPPPRFYDIVIYNKKCIFGLHLLFWRRSPKTLGTFVGEQLSSLLLCEWADFWTTWKHGAWLQGGITMWLEGLNIRSHIPWPQISWGMRRAGVWDNI